MKKRRLLALVVAALLLVSTLAVVGLMNVLAAETEISSANQFATMTNGNYKLTADIDLSTVDFATIPSFTGTIDGNGKTIKGISAPLFGTLSGTVKNLTLGDDDDTITTTATNAIGTLACTIGSDLLIDGVTNKVSITSASAEAVGGFVGKVAQSNALTVKNSTNKGTVTGSDAVTGVGGFVGTVIGAGASEEAHAKVSIDSSVNNGAIANPSGTDVYGAAGFVGSADKFTITITQSLNTGDVTSAGAGLAGFFGTSTKWERDVSNSCDKLVIGYCANYGNITATEKSQGPAGIAGRMNRGRDMTYTFEYCYNVGKITGGSYAGGIFAYTNNSSGIVLTVVGCYNIGEFADADYTHMMGLPGALMPSNDTNNYYIGSYTEKSNEKYKIHGEKCDDLATLNQKVTALGEYIVLEGTDHAVLKWQCPHQKTVSTLFAEYCDTCKVKIRDIENTSISFDEGTVNKTADNAYTVSTKGISSFVSYRSGAMGGTRDIRFVLAVDLEAAKTYDYINVTVTFYKDEQVAKALTIDYKDLDFYLTATAAGDTYTAGDGDALFGLVIKGVPIHSWDKVILSAEVSKDKAVAAWTDNDLVTSSSEEASSEIGVMTFNLRYDSTSHACMALRVRGPHLMQIIDKYEPDSVGFNEATNNWMNYLRGNMSSRGYAYVGVGRDTGTDKSSSTGDSNEYSPIFYKKDKYEVLESSTFWLSKTPETPKTKGWGSGYNRICTYAVLKNKETGEIYAHFSTHLDHKDMEAQENSVSIIETYVRTVLETYGNIGIVVTGDFNTVEFEPNNPDYDAATYNSATSFLDDTRYLATELGVVGKSFMGYDPEQWELGYETDKDKPNIDTSAAPIDFIFVKKGAYTCSYYTVVNDTFTFTLNGKTWHNHPVSDHYGIYAKVTHAKTETAFSKDNTKLIDYKATVSTTKPDSFVSKLTEGFSLISTFNAVDEAHAIDNLLKEDNSVAKISVSGSKHGYWEITLSAYSEITFNGLSLTTGSGTLPYNMKVLVSLDGTSWKQVGACFDEKLSDNTTYYVKPDEVITTQYVRIAFTDTPDGAELSNITLYASMKDDGRIYPNQITTTAGPSFGGSEGCQNLFDGTNAKKFYTRQYNADSVPSNPDPLGAIYFETDVAVTITSYTMINANDTSKFPGRLPRQWTLYGSTDGENYVVIDTETDPGLSSANYASKSYTVDTPGSYQYYKLVFVVGKDGNVQFAEIELFKTVS